MMVYAEDGVEELDERALSVASTAILMPFALFLTFVIEHSSW